jgi:hypothetical protein
MNKAFPKQVNFALKQGDGFLLFCYRIIFWDSNGLKRGSFVTEFGNYQFLFFKVSSHMLAMSM